uniref:ANF_receptor domain-containing protein n=1 Tax=Caenorhabditis japonica TaxID=281687 RepID=A0A8R1DMM9_CAEJA
MSDLVINQKIRPDISRPQWDQRTYLGRVRHFFSLTNPLTLLSSEERQERCRQIVTDYRKGKVSPLLTVDELWDAKVLYDSTYHPDTGEKMFFLGRMSAQMPANMLINGMLLSLYRTFPGVVFSHFINQSFNAVVNYTNRSGSVKASDERLLLSYCCATGGAMSAALALNMMFKNRNSVAARLVPFAAVALANAINIPMVRSNEVTEGMELRDENGELVGRSRQMAILSIAQVTLSRIGMAMPDMVTTPIIMNRITRTTFYRTHPWMRFTEYPIQTMFAGMALLFTTPMCCALFPQKTAIEIKVGIAAAQTTQSVSIGWSQCGGAVPLAIERLKNNGFVANFDFEYFVEYTECDLSSTVRAAIKFTKELKVDLIIGPPCAQALREMTVIANIYETPVLGWGFVSQSDLSDTSRFPYLATVLPTSLSLGYVAAELLELFNWHKVALVYYKNELNYCASVIEDVETAFNDPSGWPIQIVLKEEVTPDANGTVDGVLNTIKERARDQDIEL